ncbi:MAG: hypothetical protein H6622_00670 [Halobacteriovoraceae bacterium]|nr:hypothetical protein [Halobacteriovoraceae bacterium]
MIFFNSLKEEEKVEDAAGFLLGVTAGTTFFRTSDVNLDIKLNYRYIFDKTGQGNPSIISVAVGIFTN